MDFKPYSSEHLFVVLCHVVELAAADQPPWTDAVSVHGLYASQVPGIKKALKWDSLYRIHNKPAFPNNISNYYVTFHYSIFHAIMNK